ncbi:hypothetical protein [Parvibaculum sp.]
MRPVEIVPGFRHRQKPMHDPAATLIVSVLLAAIVAAGFAALVFKAGGGS